jgi:hypothetical protein
MWQHCGEVHWCKEGATAMIEPDNAKRSFAPDVLRCSLSRWQRLKGIEGSSMCSYGRNFSGSSVSNRVKLQGRFGYHFRSIQHT